MVPRRPIHLKDIRPRGPITGDKDIEPSLLVSWYTRHDGRTLVCPGKGAWYTHEDDICGPCHDEAEKAKAPWKS